MYIVLFQGCKFMDGIILKATVPGVSIIIVCTKFSNLISSHPWCMRKWILLKGDQSVMEKMNNTHVSPKLNRFSH